MEVIPSVFLFFQKTDEVIKNIGFFSNLTNNFIGLLLPDRLLSNDIYEHIKSENNTISIGCFYDLHDKYFSEKSDFIVIPYFDSIFDEIREKFRDKKIIISFYLKGNISDTDKIIESLQHYFICSVKYPQYFYAVYLNSLFYTNVEDLAHVLKTLGIHKIILEKHQNLTSKVISNWIDCMGNEMKSDFDFKAQIQLKNLRKKTDRLDETILKILSQRKELVSEMGEIKEQNHVQLFDPFRLAEIFRKQKNLAKKYNLDEKFIEKIFEIIHLESLKTMLKK